MRRFIASIAILSFALTALAAKAEETRDAQKKDQKSKVNSGDGCVFSNTINDWQVIDNRTLAVWAPSRKTPYIVELAYPAAGLKFETALGFQDRNSDGRFCEYGGDSIVVPGPVPERIPIARIRRVDPEELTLRLAEAEKAQEKPKAALPEQTDMKSEKPAKPQEGGEPDKK